MKLYEIRDEILACLSTGGDDGEIPFDAADRLAKLEIEFEDKCEAICKLISNTLADHHGYKAESDRLEIKASSSKRKAEWLKDYLKNTMHSLGCDRIEVGVFNVWMQNNGRPSITVREGAAIPEQFRKVKVELDGNAAWEAWKEGKTLPPQLVVEVGQHLRIK